MVPTKCGKTCMSIRLYQPLPGNICTLLPPHPNARPLQIVGPSGCGKTQFCLQAAVTATLPADMGGMDTSVLYIDTEGAFRPDRCV